MKKILSIITAGTLALLALSCVKEEMAVVDFSKATAPVLQSAEVGKDLVIQFTPAVFNMDFNKNMKTYHTIALVSIGGQSANVTLSAKADGDKLSVSGKTISNLLKGRKRAMSEAKNCNYESTEFHPGSVPWCYQRFRRFQGKVLLYLGSSRGCTG